MYRLHPILAIRDKALPIQAAAEAQLAKFDIDSKHKDFEKKFERDVGKLFDQAAEIFGQAHKEVAKAIPLITANTLPHILAIDLQAGLIINQVHMQLRNGIYTCGQKHIDALNQAKLLLTEPVTIAERLKKIVGRCSAKDKQNIRDRVAAYFESIEELLKEVPVHNPNAAATVNDNPAAGPPVATVAAAAVSPPPAATVEEKQSVSSNKRKYDQAPANGVASSKDEKTANANPTDRIVKAKISAKDLGAQGIFKPNSEDKMHKGVNMLCHLLNIAHNDVQKNSVADFIAAKEFLNELYKYFIKGLNFLPDKNAGLEKVVGLLKYDLNRCNSNYNTFSTRWVFLILLVEKYNSENPKNPLQHPHKILEAIKDREIVDNTNPEKPKVIEQALLISTALLGKMEKEFYAQAALKPASKPVLSASF